MDAALDGIVEKYSSEFYPFEVRQSGGGWQFLTKKLFHKTVVQLNGEFRVNSFTSGDQVFPSIAMDASGDSVIVWSSRNQDGDNFGVYGERPSNPELLDYLASRFVREGWSIKKQIRFLLLSQTFQQSSKSSPAPSQLLFHSWKPSSPNACTKRPA